MTSSNEEDVIARLHHAFAHNVKSRSEAARIRNDVAAKVKSYVVYDEQGEGNPIRVKFPGKDVTGIRRRYLDALRANIEACERSQRSSLDFRDSQTLQPQQVRSREDLVLSHLEALRLRQHYQELDIRSRYMHSLSQDASASCNLDISQSEQTHGSNCENFQDLHDGLASSVTQVDALISKLQKAVLQANHQLERQKTLLAEIEQAHADSGLAGSSNRARALAASQDVLVAWLDEKLSEQAPDHALNATQGEPSEKLHHSLPSVTEYYQRYLDARKEVLEASEEALRPSMSPSLASYPDDGESSIGEQSLLSGNLLIVHAVSRHLVPRLRIQSDNSALRSYLTAQAAKERQKTVEVLVRLADESHLLSRYPSDNINGKDQLTSNVAAWRSALSVASESAMKVIEQNERAAQQALNNGEDALAQLMTYNDHETSSRKNAGIKWKGIHGQSKNSNAT